MRKLRRFYTLLGELYIGLYSDSQALSIGPINRPELPLRVQEAYAELKASNSEDLETAAEDYLRVLQLAVSYYSLPEENRVEFLEKNMAERRYLTKKTLEYAGV